MKGFSKAAGTLKLVLDSPDGKTVNAVTYSAEGSMKLPVDQSGVHDLYFIFETGDELTIDAIHFELQSPESIPGT